MNHAQGGVEKYTLTLVEQQAFVNYENTEKEPRHGVEAQIEVNHEQGHGKQGQTQAQHAELMGFVPIPTLAVAEKHRVDKRICRHLE